VMETEIWPILYRECGSRKIPLVLVSARISPKSVVSYRKFLPLFRETLSHGIVIAAQYRIRQLAAQLQAGDFVQCELQRDFSIKVSKLPTAAHKYKSALEKGT